ncbi:hypothetical protein VKT23_002987 [Stygiomarasmius scandens]|uniref:DUF6534 domain-containing protein n=1 Tax=Marasmiellus scandens TaxID=2682957 RepID=A0ABR1JXB5_9AGAR
MLFSINTGMVTSLCACCSLLFILVLDERRLVYICFYFIIGRLYSNSLLATLNARQRIRGDSPDNDDNDPFSLPITFTHSLTQRSRPSIFSNPFLTDVPISPPVVVVSLLSVNILCSHRVTTPTLVLVPAHIPTTRVQSFIPVPESLVLTLSGHPMKPSTNILTVMARILIEVEEVAPIRIAALVCPLLAFIRMPWTPMSHKVEWGDALGCLEARYNLKVVYLSSKVLTRCLLQNDPRAPVLTPVSIQLSGDQLPESMYDKDTNHSDLLSPSRAGQTRDSSRQNRHSSRSSWRSSRSILSPLTVWRAWSNASDRSQGSTCGNADAVQERGIRLAELNLNAERDKKAPSGQQDSDEGQGAEDDDQDITDITDSYISTPSTPSRYSLPPLQTSFGVITSQSGEITSPETSANSDDKLPNFGREYQFTDRRQSVASHRHMSEIRYSAWTQTDEDSHDDNLWHGSEKSQTRQRVSTFGDLGY